MGNICSHIKSFIIMAGVLILLLSDNSPFRITATYKPIIIEEIQIPVESRLEFLGTVESQNECQGNQIGCDINISTGVIGTEVSNIHKINSTIIEDIVIEQGENIGYKGQNIVFAPTEEAYTAQVKVKNITKPIEIYQGFIETGQQCNQLEKQTLLYKTATPVDSATIEVNLENTTVGNLVCLRMVEHIEEPQPTSTTPEPPVEQPAPEEEKEETPTEQPEKEEEPTPEPQQEEETPEPQQPSEEQQEEPQEIIQIIEPQREEEKEAKEQTHEPFVPRAEAQEAPQPSFDFGVVLAIVDTPTSTTTKLPTPQYYNPLPNKEGILEQITGFAQRNTEINITITAGNQTETGDLRVGNTGIWTYILQQNINNKDYTVSTTSNYNGKETSETNTFTYTKPQTSASPVERDSVEQQSTARTTAITLSSNNTNSRAAKSGDKVTITIHRNTAATTLTAPTVTVGGSSATVNTNNNKNRNWKQKSI